MCFSWTALSLAITLFLRLILAAVIPTASTLAYADTDGNDSLSPLTGFGGIGGRRNGVSA